MPKRAAAKRTYIKLFPISCIQGSIRYQLDAAERGVWYDLLNLAALCGTPGVIADNDGRPYPHFFIANRLNIDLELLDRTLKKCEDEGRIHENNTGIHIVNWKEYQGDYPGSGPAREKRETPEGDPILAQFSQLYEKEIGIISAAISQELTEFAAEYKEKGAPLEWINEAFKEAAAMNKRNWKYVKAILVRWMTEGKQSKTHKQDITEERTEELAKKWEEEHQRIIEQESSAE